MVEKILVACLGSTTHGPAKITMYLKRYRFHLDQRFAVCGGSFKKVNLNRLPASQRYKRTQDPLEAVREVSGPAMRLHSDVKFIEPLPRADGADRAEEVLLPVHGDR